MPLQSFDRVGCLRRSNRVPRRWQRIGSSRCSPAAFWALMPGIPAAKAGACARQGEGEGDEGAGRRGRGKGARWGHRAGGGAEATTVQTRLSLRGPRPRHAAAAG